MHKNICLIHIYLERDIIFSIVNSIINAFKHSNIGYRIFESFSINPMKKNDYKNATENSNIINIQKKNNIKPHSPIKYSKYRFHIFKSNYVQFMFNRIHKINSSKTTEEIKSKNAQIYRIYIHMLYIVEQ